MAESVNRVSAVRYKMKAVIEFLTRKGCTPKEIFTRLKQVYCNQVFNISTVRYWARESRSDRDRQSRPKLRNSDEIREKINKKIRENRCIIQRELSGSVDVGLDTVNKFVKGLEYKRLCAKWVPKFLTREMKAQRKAICEKLLARYWAEGEEFMRNIINGDKTWVSYYDPELRDSSIEYRHSSSSRVMKVRSERSCRKLMFTVFWDCWGVVHREFVKPGDRINSDTYCVITETLKQRILVRCVRSQRTRFHLLDDNARPHTSKQTIARLQALGFEVLHLAPYSPDFALSDFFLFKHMKRHLKGI